MKRACLTAIAVLSFSASAVAAPNVANATQKGSLLVFPDIDVTGPAGLGIDTLVRIQNDGSLDVDVKCYWMDGNKNRVDFVIPITRNQAVWFDARTGQGTFQVNPFPLGPANGFDNPFLVGPPFLPTTTEANDTSGPFERGMLACWAVDGGGQNQIKWNHLSGTATVHERIDRGAAYEYNAYAFFVPTGIDQEPVGVAGTLNLNGVEYDSCPLYQIGQFSPVVTGFLNPNLVIAINRLVVTGCSLNLNQDWVPVFTKLQFDVWNEEEVKFTGAFECADSWHETFFDDVDSAPQNFLRDNLGTDAARYRIQGVKSTQCEDARATPPRVTQAVGVLAIQASLLVIDGLKVSKIGTNLAGAGKFTGKIVWDPAGVVPEGGIR
jgi:hypothetical protein